MRVNTNLIARVNTNLIVRVNTNLIVRVNTNLIVRVNTNLIVPNLIKQKFNNLWLQLAFFNKHYQTKFIKQLLNFWVLHINIFSYFM